MPTTIYDSSLITKRRQMKAESGNFINRIQNPVQPNTGYAPALGIWDQSVINDVNNGQMKYYRKGTGGLTTVDNGCPCLPAITGSILPDVPGPVRDIVVEYGSVIVTWNAPNTRGTPTSYTVYAVPIPLTAVSPVTVTGVLTTTYSFATGVLTPGVEYQILVIGVNAGGNGLPPISLPDPISAPYSAPTILSVLQNGQYDQLVISVDYQTSPKFDLTDGTGISINMYINGALLPTPSYISNIDNITNTATITVLGLSPQNQYTFTVQIVNGNDYSSISSQSDPIAPTTPPPPAVIEPAIRTATTATINFVEYDGFIATGGTFHNSIGTVVGNATVTGTSPGQQQMTVSGLVSGTSYSNSYIIVSNDLYTSSQSNRFTLLYTAPIITPPPTTTETTVTITYSSSFDVVPGTLTATLYYAVNNTVFRTVTNASSTQMTVTGLTPGTPYTDLYLKLSNSSGISLPSATFGFTTLFPPPILLASPNTTTNIATTSVTINYNNYTLDGSPPSSGTLYDASGVIGTYSTSSTQMLVDNLAAGTQYNNCYITLSNGSGTTANSAPFSFTTLFPAPILTRNPVNNITDTGATINYDAYFAFGFSLSSGTLYDASGVIIVTSAVLSTAQLTLSGLTSGTPYNNCYITLSNGSGTTANSAPFSFTTLFPAPILLASPNTTTNITTTGVTINYNNYTLNGSPPSSGTLYNANDGPIGTYSTSSTQMLVDNLAAGTQYNNCYITLSNGSGTTANSAPFSFTTLFPAPILTRNPVNNITDTGATINYDAYFAFGFSLSSGTLYDASGVIIVTSAVLSTAQLTLSGLTSGTPYNNCYITLTNGSGITAPSATFSFTTTGNPPVTNATKIPEQSRSPITIIYETPAFFGAGVTSAIISIENLQGQYENFSSTSANNAQAVIPVTLVGYYMNAYIVLYNADGSQSAQGVLANGVDILP